jgi:putative Mg2+ transporter-C (MgtC) family protein
MHLELHVVARLVAGAALGALVGLEREASDQPAGLRTHMSVALGAAMFGVISTVGFDEFRARQRDVNIQFDVTRVASTVVTGIGFLGAGMIFRRGSAVHNLTTAASLWVVSAIGLSCGVGDIGPAAVCTAVLLIALIVLRIPRDWIRRHLTHDDDSVRIVLAPGQPDAPVVDALYDLSGVAVERCSIQKQDGAFVLAAHLRADRGVQLRDRLAPMSRREDVATLQLGPTE